MNCHRRIIIYVYRLNRTALIKEDGDLFKVRDGSDLNMCVFV